MKSIFTKWSSLFAILLAWILLIGHDGNAQVTISTTFANNNGSSVVTFNFTNNSGGPVYISEIGSVPGVTGTATPVYAYYKTSAINGAVTAINTANGWTQFGFGTAPTTNNATTSVGQVFFPTATSTLDQVSIPDGATYGIAVGCSSLRYSSLGAGTFTQTAGGCSIVTGANIGYGGTLASPTNTPRGFMGYVVFNSLTPCVNPPSAGTVTGADSVCSNVAFALATTGTTFGAGMTFQWQSSPSATGPWTDITGATTPNLSSTGITSTTFYRLKASCNGGTEVISPAKQVSIKSWLDCYCTPVYTYGCSNGGTINSFATTGAAQNVSNLLTGCASGAVGYSNYTGMVIGQVQGNTFNLATTISAYGAGVKVWADWNHDGSFDPVTELVAASTTTIAVGNTFNATGTVPLTATPGLTRLRVRAVESSTAFDPCSSFYYGETEDYGFNVIQIVPCTNPPTAGTVTGTDSICPNISFSLNASGVTLAAGMAYQWQYSTSATGPWTDVTGATSPSYTNAAGIAVNTYYRIKVSCSGGADVFSPAKLVALKSFIDCYCTPVYTYGCTSGGTINSFSTAGAASNITNLNTGCASGNTGYSNYMSMIVAGMQTTTFNYTVGISNYGAGVKIWADWNHDGVFDPVTELVGASTSVIAVGGTFTGTATIPATALTGNTRLRVRAVEGSTSFDPCSSYYYGETEDYTITVIPIVPCTNPPTGGSITGIDSICPSVSFSLMSTGISLGSGLVYQWQSAAAPTGPFTNIVGATGLSYTNAAGITANTYYRVQAICSGGTPVYSTVKSVGVNLPVNCPCTPVYNYGCSNGARINSFSTTLAFVNVSNLNTACPSGNIGYSDYAQDPSLKISAVQSTTFNVAVQIGSYAGGVKIWCDWNQDGTFDPVTELATASASTIATGATYNGTITVPTTSLLGNTRMRVRVVEGSTSYDACSSGYYGETEDYKLAVLPMPDCDSATFPTAATLMSNVDTICSYGNISFSISPQMPPASSLDYIWETAPSATGPWTTAGTTVIPWFTLNGVSQTAHYRVRMICHGTEIRNIGTKQVVINSPGSLTVTNAENCGPAALTLSAVPVNPAHTVTWYTTFTGGTSIGSGTTYTTPIIGATTVYFAQPTGAGLSGCAAARTPVYAYIRPFPTPNLGSDRDTCVTGAATITLDPGPQSNTPTYLWSNGTSAPTLTVSQTGTYSVQVTNQYGCKGSDTINVAIKQLPVVDIGSNGTNLCEGSVKTLDAGPDGENGGNYYWNTGATTRTIDVSATGTYIVYVTSPDGCVTSDTTSVLVGGHIPEVDALLVTANTPNSFTFQAQNPNYVVSYDWDFGDGMTQTTTVPTVNHAYAANGNYWLKLMSSSTCDTRTDSILVTIIGLGINDLNNNLKVKVYPNPTNGQVITVEAEGSLKISEVNIFNLLGQEVYSDKLDRSTSKYQINLGNHLAAGVYNVRIQTDKGLVTRKLEIIK